MRRWVLAVVVAVVATVTVPMVAGPAAADGGPEPEATVSVQSVQYSPPEWLPFRAGAGGDIRVGCTYRSTGTQGGYECGGYHPVWAIDFGAPTGTPVYAAGAGWATVYSDVATCRSDGGYGRAVVVDHGAGVRTIYAHLSVISINRSGQQVTPATKIGEVGNTGSSTCNFPHLHFERFVSGPWSGAVDPGPLKACHGPTQVSYPQVWGRATWEGIPWGLGTVASDGTGCVADPNAYRPDGQVTRAQMAAFLWRKAGEPAIRNACGLTDIGAIPGWARDGACWLWLSGITTNDPYGAGSVVTRAQMATFLWRYAGQAPAPTECGFTDLAAIAGWARQGVCWLQAVGITNVDTFRPSAPVTRAEMAAFLWRAAGRPAAPASCGMSDEWAIPAYARTPVCWLKAQRITTTGV